MAGHALLLAAELRTSAIGDARRIERALRSKTMVTSDQERLLIRLPSCAAAPVAT